MNVNVVVENRNKMESTRVALATVDLQALVGVDGDLESKGCVIIGERRLYALESEIPHLTLCSPLFVLLCLSLSSSLFRRGIDLDLTLWYGRVIMARAPLSARNRYNLTMLHALVLRLGG